MPGFSPPTGHLLRATCCAPRSRGLPPPPPLARPASASGGMKKSHFGHFNDADYSNSCFAPAATTRTQLPWTSKATIPDHFREEQDGWRGRKPDRFWPCLPGPDLKLRKLSPLATATRSRPYRAPTKTRTSIHLAPSLHLGGVTRADVIQRPALDQSPSSLRPPVIQPPTSQARQTWLDRLGSGNAMISHEIMNTIKDIQCLPNLSNDADIVVD